MRRVILESPYKAVTVAEFARNQAYLRDAMRHSLMECNEAPFASHVMYTFSLIDTIPTERKLGMNAGFIWGEQAEATVVYEDLGISAGMKAGIEAAKKSGRPVTYRRIH